MTARLLKVTECDEDDIIAAVAEVIESGRLAVIPTETVYGLAGKPDDPAILELIYSAKSRDRGKQVPLMATGARVLQARGFSLNLRERLLADAFWPGPLTMVLDLSDGTEGVRVPDHALALRILERCGGILRVTSANQSGENAALDATMAVQSLGEKVDLIVDAGPVSGGIASTVVNCSNEGFDILREGAISSARIQRVLKDL